MIYQLQIPPFEVSSFDSLSAAQAREFFGWYVAEIPSRLDQLQRYIDQETNHAIRLTNDVASLEPLWTWFSSTIQTRQRTDAELQAALENVPLWLQPTVIKDDQKFTVETLAVGMDIAIYFAELIVANNPAIHWGYFTKPKRRDSVNEPVLLGFTNGVDLNPRQILHTLMLGHIRKKKSRGLLDIYNAWTAFIPPQTC